MFGQDRSISIQKANTPIILDGKLEEATWKEAQKAKDFQTTYPTDSLPAHAPTTVQLSFDENNLYIGAVCTNANKGDFIIQSLKRDFEFKDNDAFAVVLDAFTDANSGLYFSLNPYGVQMDAIIPRGGVKGCNKSWDGLWYAEVYRDKNQKYWSLEIAIPFKTLRYKPGADKWHINFVRNDLRKNEISTWSPIPRGFEVTTLSQTGQLIWDAPIEKQGSNISLIPYLASQSTKDYENQTPINTYLREGLDAKVAFNPSLNLDLTINPDFSQVEVDQQQINLDRFELFFPEKRLFFLENSDLFSDLGNSRVRPFFSRRIGSAGNDPVPIAFGGRLSGKINKDWRIGLMTVQTKATSEWNNESQNYSVATIQRSVLKGSNITAFLINTQSFGDFYPSDTNNSVGGLEFDYRSSDSKWSGKSFIHFAANQNKLSDNIAYSFKGRYKTTKLTFFLGLDAIGENYTTEMGYAPRLYHKNPVTDSLYRIPYSQIRSNGYYRFFTPNSNLIDFFGPTFGLNIYTDNNFQYQEHRADFSLLLRLMNSSEFEFTVSDYSSTLFFPLLLSGLNQSFPEGNYPNKQMSFAYNSGKRSHLFGMTEISYGGEYMGKRLKFSSELNYRLKHRAVLGATLSYQSLMDFPEDYGNAEFMLVGSKLELSFSRSLFLTSFIQYNTQNNNFNINSRFNWRFKPMSDLFIVYTENYFAENIAIKNRALVIKVKYWFNL